MSAIEWTDETWNPVTGCDRVSPGCAHCYALELAPRLRAMGNAKYAQARDGDPRTSGPAFGLTLHPDKLDAPLGWTRPRRVFVNSMSDLFHEGLTGLPRMRDGHKVGDGVPKAEGDPPRPDFIADVFAVMSLAERHTFQVLTKRPEAMYLLLRHPNFWLQVNAARMRRGYPVLPGGMSDFAAGDWPLPNVWLGVSVENRKFTWRADWLRATPAGIRFVSAEPLLGPLEGLNLAAEQPKPAPDGLGIDDVLKFEREEHARPKSAAIDWLIVGGESGPDHRPVKPAWVRALRDQAQEAGTAFFFKQWGGRTPKAGGRELDGRTWDEFPAPAREAVSA